MSTPKLFQPIKVGKANLQHRVVLAPLTRYRATRKEHVPIVPLVPTYYAQRSKRPGTLVVTEATFIRPEAGGYDSVPGIWNQDQIKAWKEVCWSLHSKTSPEPLFLGHRQSPCKWFIYFRPVVGSGPSCEERDPGRGRIRRGVCVGYPIGRKEWYT